MADQKGSCIEANYHDRRKLQIFHRFEFTSKFPLKYEAVMHHSSRVRLTVSGVTMAINSTIADRVRAPVRQERIARRL